MKFIAIAFIVLTLAGFPACYRDKISQPDRHEKPILQEEPLLYADVSFKKDAKKLMAEFRFYHDISEVVNEREIRGFGKAPISVGSPKIDGKEMAENKTESNWKSYSAEIENAAKEHEVSFMWKDGEYRAIINIDPNDLKLLERIEFKKKPNDR